MARLIDADAMRKEWLEHGENEFVYDTNAVLDSIDAQPTVDAVPVVHGRWECQDGDFSDNWKCSACGIEWFFEYDPTETETKVNYCPDCGAKMDRGDEDV